MHLPAQRLRQQKPGVSQQQGRSPSQVLRQLPSPRQKLVGRQNLGHEAQVERLFGIERLARQKEIAPSIYAQQQRVDNVHAVARHYVGRKVRRILKLGGIGGQHDVAEKGDLGMAPGRTVDGADDRHLNVEQLHQEVATLPLN